MAKLLTALAVLTVVVAASSALVYVFSDNSGQRVATPLPSRFTANGKTFAITYVAAAPSQWRKGLMNTSISDNTTMLFIFPEPGYRSFWMYDVDSSLDIIWIDASNQTGRVVYMVADAPPCFSVPECPSYTPTNPANYVLEAKASFAVLNNITVGTVIQLG